MSLKSPMDLFDQLQFDLECDTQSWLGRNAHQTESLPQLLRFINKHTSNVRLLQKEIWKYRCESAKVIKLLVGNNDP